MILDSWLRSKLPAGDFAPLVGISKHTLYLWKKRFSQHGPAGLAEHPRGASTGSKLPKVTKRTIVMLKELHPEWKGPTAAQLWEQRPSITSAERASFLAMVTEQRAFARAALQLPPDTPLGHYPAAAVDRRAVRDTLLAHGLLKIEPRRRPKGPPSSAKKTNLIVPFASGAVILQPTAGRALPALGQSVGPEVPSAPLEIHSPEKVHCSTDNSAASAQNYG